MNPVTVPQRPVTIAATSLDEAFLVDLAVKTLAVKGTVSPSVIATEMCLSKAVANELVGIMISQLLVESQGLAGDGLKSEIRYNLTDAGLKRALEAMSKCAYVGPAPVLVGDLIRQIGDQSISRESITLDRLRSALSHLVVDEELLFQLGPAVNSCRSILLFGEPGNGKTSIAEALTSCFDDIIYIPYSVIVGGQLIKFFDETVHSPVEISGEDAMGLDRRWVPCRRPVVLAGGELRLDDLDLKFDPVARYSEAPMHTKALGGIFVVDDFGRQKAPPQDFLNRWIVPLEKGVDFFALHTGVKFSLPHDQLVIFSTNHEPEEIGDSAAMRRIYFKLFVRSPNKSEFIRIFRSACVEASIDFEEGVISEFFDRNYVAKGLVSSGAHPRFLITHIKAASAFLGLEPKLDSEALNRAWRNVTVARSRVQPESS